jgi:hypothetical protein
MVSTLKRADNFSGCRDPALEAPVSNNAARKSRERGWKNKPESIQRGMQNIPVLPSRLVLFSR